MLRIKKEMKLWQLQNIQINMQTLSGNIWKDEWWLKENWRRDAPCSSISCSWLKESKDNTSFCPADWRTDCDIRRSGLDWHSTALRPSPRALPPPHALQSSWLHQQGIILSCRSKRNRSSYCKRIHMLRMNESRTALKNKWDRLKGISEWTKSELCCAVTVAEHRTHRQGNNLVNLHECVALPIQI